MIYFKVNWNNHLPLIEFAYNNSYHSSFQMSSYESLYGGRCRSPIGLFEVSEDSLIGPDIAHHVMDKVKVTQDRSKVVQNFVRSPTMA